MSNKRTSRSGKPGFFRRWLNIPKDLHSKKFSVRNRAQRLLALTVCVPLLLASAIYIAHWYRVKNKTEQENAAYSAMYKTPEPTSAPEVTSVTESPVKTEEAETASPTPTIEATATIAPTESIEATAAPTATTEPTAAVAVTSVPSAVPTAEPTIESTEEPLPEETAVPYEVAYDELLIVNSTPGPDTKVYRLQTPPPIQSSFKELLEANSETVGFITIGSQVSLPVVQKSNDNEYYLTHNFAGEESESGTLFLDGSNMLVPEDPVLLIYGHNMRNGTMFQPLTCYERLDYLRANPVVHFDTIYKNRSYKPVAVFRASMDIDSENYFNIRQFTFDETSWELYILKLEKLSMYNLEIDAKPTDHLLLLVTCEYTKNNGRLVVVLRELRSGETEESARQYLSNAKLK